MGEIMDEYYAIKDAETPGGGTDWSQVPQKYGGTRTSEPGDTEE